jgi:DNA repair protein RadC
MAPLERHDRGLVLLGGVHVGAGRPRGVDGALGLVHFRVGRRGTRRRESGDDQGDAWQEGSPTGECAHRTSICESVPAALPAALTVSVACSTMRSLVPHDRPRERLGRLGVDALGDQELVAIVLGHGGPRQSALGLAELVLASMNGVHGLTRASVDQLAQLAGVGRAKAAQLLAAVELGRRTLTRAPAVRVQLGSPRDAAAYLTPRFGGGAVERFGIVLLDTKHRVLKAALLSVGTLDASLVHPREVFREASTAGAAAIVLFHNHPSGDPTPSRDDATLTARLVEAGELMGIVVLDHVVLGEARYFSFKESGRL